MKMRFVPIVRIGRTILTASFATSLLLTLLVFPAAGQSAAEWNTYKQQHGIDSHWIYNDWVAAGCPQGGSANTGTGGGPVGGSPAQQQSASQMGEAIGKGLFGQPSDGGAASSGPSQQQIAAQQLNNAGVQSMKWGKYDTAIQQLRKARMLNPGDSTIEANLKRALSHQGDGQKIYGSGNQSPPVSDNSAYSSDAGANQSGNQVASGTPPPAASASDQGSDQTVGIKGLPGIYLNDTTGNGSDKGYGIKGLPGIYVNGAGEGSGLTPPGATPATATDSPATQTATAPESETVVGLPPATQPTETPTGKPTINLGNAGNPDFDGNKGGNSPITGSGGSGPAMPSSSAMADAGQPPPGGPSSGSTAPTQSGGQQAVPMGVPPDKAGLTPLAGGAEASSGKNTSAADQLMSAAAAGQNSGKNFDTGGKYAGSLGGAGNDTSVVDLRGTAAGNVTPGATSGGGSQAEGIDPGFFAAQQARAQQTPSLYPSQSILKNSAPDSGAGSGSHFILTGSFWVDHLENFDLLSESAMQYAYEAANTLGNGANSAEPIALNNASEVAGGTFEAQLFASLADSLPASIPSTPASVAESSLADVASRADSTLAAESKVLVIGENMSQRVIPYAEKIGAEIYPGMPGYKAGMQAEALLDNGLYIEKAKALDYRIIDIGPDFARRAATGTASEGYQMERFLTKDYAGYEKAFSR